MYRRGSVILLAAGLLIGSFACLGTVRVQQTMSPAFGDLATVKLVELVDSSGTVLMRGTFDAPTTTGAKVERTAELTRPTSNVPVGEAEIDLDRNNGISEEEFLIKAEDLPYPASCRVMVDGLEIAQFSTTRDGKIDLRVYRRLTSGQAR
jgi:hypothetical protein